MALYAVYESGFKEIAKLIQEKKSDDQYKGRDMRLTLKCAKRYCQKVLNYEENEYHMKMLCELRNAFAHANGHLESVNGKSRKIIQKWINQKKGIKTCRDYIVCEDNIVSEIFTDIRDSLNNLISRYNNWIDIHSD